MRRRYGGWKKEKKAFQFLTVVGLFVYTGLTYCQLGESHRTLVASQRAFVYADHVEWHAVQKEGALNLLPMGMAGYGKTVKTVVEITVTIENSGGTEPSDLRVQIECPKLDGNVADPFASFKWDDAKAKSEFLGPRQTKEIGPCAELSKEDVGANAIGFAPRYVLGEIRYSDAFGNSRVTQFATEVRFFNEEIANLRGRAVSVGRHNCTDDACPKD